MKKAIATMLSLAILLSTFLFDIQVNAAALEKPQLVLTQTDVMQGDIFTSTLYFEKYSSISAASFTFAYNPEYVELISCVPNEDCIVTPVIKSDIIGSISISIASGTNISAKMPLIDVSFKVNDDLAVGKYDLLKLTGTNNYVRRLDNDNILQTVEFDYITSDLNIYSAGDINLDGKVDGSDAVYMLRYEAGLNSGKSDLPFYLPYYENIDEYNEHQRFILRVADAYYDGTVNGSDAVSVLRHEVGFDEMLGNRTDVIFYDEDGKELIVKNVIINEELKKIPEVPKKDGMKGMWSLSLAEYEEPNFSNVTTKLKVYPYYITDKCDHTMQRTAAKSATCTEDGNIEYWYCEKCEKYFSDGAGDFEISFEDTAIKAKGHTVVVDEAVPATYEHTGLTEGSHCSVCKETIVVQETVPMLQANYHSITYKNLNGAESPEITRYAEHDGLLDMPELSVDGYKFVGWYTQSVGGTIVDYIPAGSTKDYVLFAHWELESYTITYKDAPVNSNVTTYTVEDRIVLADPQWSGLKFVKWTNAEGQPCSEIAKGTTGDVELTANWQLLENTAVPAEGVRELWTDYDEKNGHQIFIYELGKIHHVVLEELDSKYKYYGEALEWQEEKTVSLDESISREVSTAVSNSVTKTSEHAITNDWTKSHSDTFERGFHVGVEWSPIKDILKFEAGGEFNWTDTNENSWSESTTNSEGLAESIENTTSNSSTVVYNETISRSFTTSATIREDMPEGEYRYVYYGTVRVFAVVTYEPSSGNYRLDTVSVLDEGIGSMPLYTPPANTTANIQVSGGLPCVFPLEELEAFIADSYYVRYDSNGGTGTMYSGYYPVNQEHILSENQFIKHGYTWIDWKVDGIEKTVQKGELVSNLGKKGQQITAVAQWAKNSYSITYNENKPANASSSVLNLPSDTSCVYDENVTLGTAPTLTGWTFDGWFMDAACTVEVGKAEETLVAPNLTTTPGATVTLYAKWTPNTYTVTYHANNGTGTTVASTHAYDTSSNLSANGFTRAEYTFLGWSTDSTATIATYTNKQTVKNLATSGNVTLYAVWVKTSATIHFTPDNGTRDITFTEGKTRTESISTNMSISDLTKNGYTSVTISVSFDCKSENNWIMFNSAALKVVARNTNLYSGSWHLKNNMSGSWENKTVTITVDLTKLNEDASFNLVWSQPSGTGNGEEWYLGTTVVTVTAKK